MSQKYVLAETLRAAFNAANPDLPLPSGDERYVHCSDVRGDQDVVEWLWQTVTWSERSDSTQLFTGHRGCGKSTELMRLRTRLENDGYAVIYFEADELLDINDITYSDILVATARQVYENLAEMGVGLSDSMMNDVTKWFAEVVYEGSNYLELKAELEAEAKMELPKLFSPFLQLMARITGQLRTGTESKKLIRQRLDPQITQLIDRLNQIMDTARLELRKREKLGLVVIIDNLDRIPYMTPAGTDRNIHDMLYIDHSEQLKSLHCHVIYTVPIALCYSKQMSDLRQRFPETFILPMIKVHDRNWQPLKVNKSAKGSVEVTPGLLKLRQILAQRIHIEKLFEPAALDLLCAISGGHPRELMILVRHTCRFASEGNPQPITVNVAERAIDRLLSDYSRMIQEEHYPLLAAVHRSKTIESDDLHRSLLHSLSLLEYVNAAPEPWHDVHPVILRLTKFQEAWNQLQDGD